MLIVKHFASHLKVPATIKEFPLTILCHHIDVLFLRVRKMSIGCQRGASSAWSQLHSCTPTRNSVSGGNERNRTHGASWKVGFLDSGNGTAPRCLKVALSGQTSLLLRGLQAHLDWHQSVRALRENILQKKKKKVDFKLMLLFGSFICYFFANPPWLCRQFYLHLHLSWSSCGCNLSWGRYWWWRQITD